MARVKYLKVETAKPGSKFVGLNQFPNFHASGSVKGMKKKFYGEDALLVKRGSYIYNVTSKPDIYYWKAK